MAQWTFIEWAIVQLAIVMTLSSFGFAIAFWLSRSRVARLQKEFMRLVGDQAITPAAVSDVNDIRAMQARLDQSEQLAGRLRGAIATLEEQLLRVKEQQPGQAQEDQGALNQEMQVRQALVQAWLQSETSLAKLERSVMGTARATLRN